jgi:hypothetical protein
MCKMEKNQFKYIVNNREQLKETHQSKKEWSWKEAK